MKQVMKPLVPTLLAIALFNTILACGSGGGSSDDNPIVEIPIEYDEKISSILITDTVVIFAVEVADTRFELFSVDPTTGIKKGISDTFSATRGLKPAAVSPDGLSIVYRADNDNDGFDELYSNSINGGSEVLLTDNIATSTINETGTTVHKNWQWTGATSGNQIVFRSDPDNDDVFEIQSIAIDGSNLLTLSQNLSIVCPSSDCWDIATDGSYVIFLVEVIDQDSNLSQSIYSVTPDGVGLIMLNQDLEADSKILSWQWSPDLNSIAYISQNSGEIRQLYTVSPIATERTLLNPDSQAAGVKKFVWSPDSQRLAFDDDPLQLGVLSLYHDLKAGSDRIHLIDNFDVTSPVIEDWQWSPDNSRIGYRSNQTEQEVVELYTVQVDGNWHRKMNGVLLDDSIIQAQWLWSSDSTYISFASEQETVRPLDELYVSNADGSGSKRVNLDFVEEVSLLAASEYWLDDASRLVYSTTKDGTSVSSIYSVLPDGTGAKKLTPTLDDLDSFGDLFLISPDNTSLLFQVSSSTGSLSLQSALFDGSVKNNLSTVGINSQAQWLKDSSRVIYVFKSATDSDEALYSVLPDGTSKLKLYP